LAVEGRDHAITAIVKNALRGRCGERVLKRGGVRALLLAAASTKPSVSLGDNSSPDLTTSTETRMNISLALSKLAQATSADPQRQQPSEKFVSECIQSITYVPV
jgi:hypothetical protein